MRKKYGELRLKRKSGSRTPNRVAIRLVWTKASPRNCARGIGTQPDGARKFFAFSATSHARPMALSGSSEQPRPSADTITPCASLIRLASAASAPWLGNGVGTPSGLSIPIRFDEASGFGIGSSTARRLPPPAASVYAHMWLYLTIVRTLVPVAVRKSSALNVLKWSAPSVSHASRTPRKRSCCT